MGHPVVIAITNTDPRFYPLIGPFLSRREIVAELGFPVWDEDSKTWFVAMQDGQVAGFAAVRFEKDTAVFCSSYTLPSQRRRGIHSLLIRDRLAWLSGRAKRVIATVTPAARGNYERHGFTAVSAVNRSSRYTKMQRELCNDQL